MSDYNASLPIRTENEKDHVRVRIADSLVDANLLKIDADGNAAVKTYIEKEDGSTIAPKATNDGKQKVALFDDQGNAYSSTNPLIVKSVDETIGDDVIDFVTSAAVAKDATASLSYTVPVGKTMSIKRVKVSASGRTKAVLKFGATTKEVQFSEVGNQNLIFDFVGVDTALAAGTVLSVDVTNRDKDPQDVYATFIGTNR